jgi:hypothetical protein
MEWRDGAVAMTAFSRISKNPQVPAKVKLVFEAMQNDPALTVQLATKAVGISYYNFRRALKLPHVALWMRESHKAKVDAICAANPERLRVIANESENHMARVGAIKTLEAMKEALDPQGSARLQQTPGLVIVIQHADGRQVDAAESLPPMIEHEPEQAAEPD